MKKKVTFFLLLHQKQTSFFNIAIVSSYAFAALTLLPVTLNSRFICLLVLEHLGHVVSNNDKDLIRFWMNISVCHRLPNTSDKTFKEHEQIQK